MGNEGMKRVMSKNRFEEISRFLHLNDTSYVKCGASLSVTVKALEHRLNIGPHQPPAAFNLTYMYFK